MASYLCEKTITTCHTDKMAIQLMLYKGKLKKIKKKSS